MNEKLGLKQYLVPYLMSSHPGSQLTDAVEMAEHLRDLGYMPEQVQDFYPTPSTISTCMYYTGIDPRTGESVYIKQGRNTNTQYAKKHNDSSNTRQHRSDSKGRYSAGKRRK